MRLAEVAMALGVVVSSMPLYAFDFGSYRSERVTLSPRLRTNRVSDSGPPTLLINRIAAVLSLTSTIALQRSPTGIAPRMTFALVTGDVKIRSFSV